MKTMTHSTVLAAILAVPLLAAAVSAAVCDKTYYMQTGNLVILTGPTVNNITPQSSMTVGKDLGGVEIMHPATEYNVVNRFEGNSACTEWKQTKVDFTQRKKNANTFSQVSTTSNYIKLHATPYPFAVGVDFEYWFGFASTLRGDTAVIFEAIGKMRNGDKPHVWYGTATMTRTVREIGPGGAVTPKGTRTHYFESLTSHPDSAALQKDLLETWKDYKDNDTQTVSYKVQLIKVVYDSVPPTTGIRGLAGSKAKESGFQATQSGNLVLIRPSDAKSAPTEALGLYNMLGHKVATLHPTGYLYQWNGQTMEGAQAQTGVYFVQSNSRILGKFFYTR